MSTELLEPARTIIEKIGGEKAQSISAKCIRVGEIIGLDRSRVYRWMRPRQAGGRDGLVPDKYQRVLLEYARANKIDLSASDFFVAEPKRSNGRVPLVA